jgi:uncharacterized protein (DUF4415 family)
MGAKKEHIVRYTAEELQAMRARGEDKTDWDKVMSAPLPDGSDPDDHWGEEPGDDIFWTTDSAAFPRPKTQLTVRLDADVVDWFKSFGPGYQTRMNLVLRNFYQQHKKG